MQTSFITTIPTFLQPVNRAAHRAALSPCLSSKSFLNVRSEDDVGPEHTQVAHVQHLAAFRHGVLRQLRLDADERLVVLTDSEEMLLKHRSETKVSGWSRVQRLFPPLSSLHNVSRKH
eukprot:6212117-Pleurochrysis_carterae.AAC.2